MLSHETAGEAFAPQQRRNLPNRILRAFDAAQHIDGLARALRTALAELVRYVPQTEPFATIFAHKASIAARMGVTERTLYRHLGGLRAAGLIDVLPQERKSRNGRFAVARIRLTRRAAELIGLVDPIIAPVADVIHTPPYDNLSGDHTVSEPTIAKTHRSAARNGVLPADLSHLTGQGLSKAGIFKLMGLAKARGKRLSDIVVAIEPRLQEIKGGGLYAYLAKLAEGPTDFSHAAAQARQAKAQAHESALLQGRLARFKERFRGASLTSRNGNALYRIDREARFVQVVGEGRTGTAPLHDMVPWMRAVERGDLVLATASAEQRHGLH